MIFKNIAVVSIKENSYRITFFGMNKYNPANFMKKSGIKGKKKMVFNKLKEADTSDTRNKS